MGLFDIVTHPGRAVSSIVHTGTNIATHNPFSRLIGSQLHFVQNLEGGVSNAVQGVGKFLGSPGNLLILGAVGVGAYVLTQKK